MKHKEPSPPSTPSESLQREIKKAERERLERTLLLHIRAAGLPEPEREYRFLPGRMHRFDFAWPEPLKIAAECEGGTWTGKSRHTRGKGFEEDCWKYNQAALRGWRVFRFTGDMIREGIALLTLRQVLEENQTPLK